MNKFIPSTSWLGEFRKTRLKITRKYREREYDIYPHMNGLSDHDAQMLILCTVQKLGQHYPYMKRMINSDTIANLQIQLSYELWESVFDEDVNRSFNIFLNTFLKIYYSSFPLVWVKYMWNNNLWITPGIILHSIKLSITIITRIYINRIIILLSLYTIIPLYYILYYYYCLLYCKVSDLSYIMYNDPWIWNKLN
jgi:hypothetical protein